MNTLKSLQYAYKTSPNAEKYNQNRGCWLVFNHGIPQTKNPAVFQDDEKLIALEFFQRSENAIDTFKSFTEHSTPFKI